MRLAVEAAYGAAVTTIAATRRCGAAATQGRVAIAARRRLAVRPARGNSGKQQRQPGGEDGGRLRAGATRGHGGLQFGISR